MKKSSIKPFTYTYLQNKNHSKNRTSSQYLKYNFAKKKIKLGRAESKYNGELIKFSDTQGKMKTEITGNSFNRDS